MDTQSTNAVDKPYPLAHRLFVALQYLLPHHPLSRIVHRAMRLEVGWLKDWVIRWFIGRFRIDLSQAQVEDPTAYRSFNAFFTRALKPDARPICTDSQTVVCPVDATVSQFGPIESGRIIQAKRHAYSATELLGNAGLAAPFANGQFITLYLSPRDYHRIHMPVEGSLRQSIYIPGRLFSVNGPTTEGVPRLFARNERVALLFDTAAGPCALVMVGALFVGSIETVWAGEMTPPHRSEIALRDFSLEPTAPHFAPGAEIGRFNMGSTVVLLFGNPQLGWASEVTIDATTRMGQRLAAWN